jgi:beta-barrel assembly-enhancing protease
VNSLFYNLGRQVGPHVRKAKWLWHSVNGSKANAIKMENYVGRDLAAEIRNKLEPAQNSQIEAILNRIGSRLSKCVVNKLRTFTFELVKDDEPNAFALPGGFVFITQSLMELCHCDEDELAFILSHEMAHVIKGHAINRIISSSAIKIVSGATASTSLLPVWLKKLSIQFLESAYSRQLEFAADELGVYLSNAAGYNPQSAVQLLERLAKFKTSENQMDFGRYFSSHPPFSDRISDINRLLARLRAQSKS